MKLTDQIVVTKPREKSGSVSSSRFDYQKDWSLCKLIDTHRAGVDYIVIFDWHEDLLIMDSESSPNSITFYQIKGRKSGNWSVQSLIKSEEGKGGEKLLSIIGKLYDCKSKFSTSTGSLNFVSNARYNVKLSRDESSLSKDSICIIELEKEEKEKIVAKIKEEHKLKFDPEFEDITFLKVIDLSLEDSSGHAKGKITEFLDEILPGKTFNIPSVYRMLFDEIKRRANYSKEILNFKDLVSYKGIAKSQFEQIIKATGIKVDYKAIWSKAESELLSNSVSFHDRRKLNQSWTKLELEKMEPNNTLLFNLIIKIKHIKVEEEKKFPSLNLVQQIETVLSRLKATETIPVGFDDYYLKAIILFELYE